MPEKRQTKRFVFQRLVVLRFHREDIWREVQGTVENAGEMGILLISESQIPHGTDVQLTILMPSHVRVSASGKVVRVEQRSDGKFVVAVECDSPWFEGREIADAVPNLRVTTQGPLTGGAFIVHCDGRIARNEATGFRDKVLHLLAETPRIVVNLRNVWYIDSVGLGILTGLYTSAKRKGGEVKLVAPAPRAKDVLHRTHLDTRFSIYEGDADAIAAFR